MRHNFLFFARIVVLFPFIVWGQSNPIDSFKILLQQSTTDSARWFNSCSLCAAFAPIDLDSALVYGELSLDFARRANNLKQQASSMYTVGAIYYYKGDTPKAVEWYLKAYETAEKGGYKGEAGVSLNNIGLIYSETKDLEKAVYYLNQALDLARQAEDTAGITRAFTNIGLAYYNSDRFDTALYYFNEQVNYAKAINDMDQLATGYNNLGAVYIEMNNLPKAKENLFNALNIRQESGDSMGLVNILGNIGEIYMKENNADEAIQYCRRSLAIAQTLENYSLIADAANRLSEYYAKVNNFQLAYETRLLQAMAKDSIYGQEKLERTDEMEARFRNQQQATRLAEQALTLEKQKSAQIRIIIGGIALLLLLTGIFQYLRNKQQFRRKDAELAAQKAEATASLEKAKSDKLREMDALKSNFFANISHEFRTPLTLILHPVEQLVSGQLTAPDQKKYHQIIQRNAQRLLDLVNQLLDLAKLESGKMKLRPAKGDLNRFVAGVVYSFESLASHRDIHYNVNIPDAVDQVYFDRDKVEKILVNLVSNAFKFTEEGGSIFITLFQDGTMVEIGVRDTGTGIPIDQLPYLFDRFYRSTKSELQEGSGLGLALTKELVELHGGNISVQSKIGQGTAFKISLQTDLSLFKPEEVELLPDSEIAPPVYTPSYSLKPTVPLRDETRRLPNVFELDDKPRLLIVEDNREVRALLKDHFAGEYHLLEAENGKIGMERAIEEIPDLIISDIMMPEMDGMEFCAALKQDEKTAHIPVIMLTARADQADKLQGLETGADDYLMKPFDAKELSVRVANLIKQRRRLRAHFKQSFSSFAPSSDLPVSSVDAHFLSNIKEVIESCLDDENFGVVDLGSKVGMSRSQLHRKLTALTGFSPNEVIRNIRLERAKQLLEKKAGNASEVAFLCGFNSPSYFAKCFKDYFGHSPSEI